jgi:hypothetical protein
VEEARPPAWRGRAEFGRLKHEWALLPLWVRRIERVRRHADLAVLARLACALAACPGDGKGGQQRSTAALDEDPDRGRGESRFASSE